MDIVYSKHWAEKHPKKKKGITKDALEFAINNSVVIKDKYWNDAFNAISRIPPSGRILKVVYKRLKRKVFIMTAFWLD
jgi:hypothetical protein